MHTHTHKHIDDPFSQTWRIEKLKIHRRNFKYWNYPYHHSMPMMIWMVQIMFCLFKKFWLENQTKTKQTLVDWQIIENKKKLKSHFKMKINFFDKILYTKKTKISNQTQFKCADAQNDLRFFSLLLLFGYRNRYVVHYALDKWVL